MNAQMDQRFWRKREVCEVTRAPGLCQVSAEMSIWQVTTCGKFEYNIEHEDEDIDEDEDEDEDEDGDEHEDEDDDEHEDIDEDEDESEHT
jgi:ABC-type Zn2+ transport system substrate-binding protein/surface adhesin